MKARGRPLRFLALIVIGWIGARIALLWPQTGSLPAAIEALVPGLIEPKPNPAPESTPVATARTGRPKPDVTRGRTLSPEPVVSAAPVAPSSLPLAPFVEPPVQSPPPAPQAFTLNSQAPRSPPDRWSLSGWFAARAGGSVATAPGGQIGGGQAGVRVAYRLPMRERLSVFMRLTTPLAGKGRETALGLEWQPGPAPVRLLIEQRVGLDGTPGGSGFGALGGIDTKIHGFRLEGYAQTGVIARQRAEPYADGAARLTRPLGRVALGFGAWGAAQRDAQRFDLGPTATIALGHVRIMVDWRQRVGGQAKPGSGLALTLGGDF